jgi:hypothetical protein
MRTNGSHFGCTGASGKKFTVTIKNKDNGDYVVTDVVK